VRLLLRGGFALTLPALAVALASCGGDSPEKVDAEDWVADVCDRAADFEEEFIDAGEPLNDIDDRSDPDEIKDAIDQFVEDASDIIDAFIKDVEEIGEPDIDGGSDVLKAMKEHADERKDILARFRDDVNDLDDDDEDDFRDGVFDLLDDVDDPDFRDRLEDIDERDVDDLIDMIDEDPACAGTLFSS